MQFNLGKELCVTPPGLQSINSVVSHCGNPQQALETQTSGHIRLYVVIVVLPHAELVHSDVIHTASVAELA